MQSGCAADVNVKFLLIDTVNGTLCRISQTTLADSAKCFQCLT